MSGDQEPLAFACFGVPGPIINGEASATNVHWKMVEASLSRALGGTRVRLINDLGAAAYGVIHLADSELSVLQPGTFQRNQGNIAIIAAGTGLGEAALVLENGRHYAVASEGGHASFAPRNEEQIELYRYLHARFGHVSVERVLSGPGLFNIYSFVREHERRRNRNGSPQRLEEGRFRRGGKRGCASRIAIPNVSTRWRCSSTSMARRREILRSRCWRWVASMSAAASRRRFFPR